MDRLPAVLALVLVLAATLPHLAAAQPVPGRNQGSLSVLAYHPYPDDRDPLGVPAVNGSEGPVDRMNGYYGATWFPTVRVDGVLEAANEPGGTVDDPEATYEAMIEDRLARGAPAVLAVRGTLGEERARVNVTTIPRVDAATDRVVLRVALFEDDVPHQGGNGVTEHPFTVRAVADVGRVPMEPDQAQAAVQVLPLNDTWNRARLGAVAFLQNEDDRGSLDHREVLQSATYRFAQDGPTVQTDKAPLLEMYTASWCDPCAPADRAVERLAEAYGAAPPDPGPPGYLVEPHATRLALGLLAGLVLAAALVPRGRPEA